RSGTIRESNGSNHGWLMCFAPAVKQEIVIGAIIEFARHGTAVAPLVSRAIAHYLGIDERTAAQLQVTVPNDSAPAPFRIPLVPDTIRPVIPDTTRPSIRIDSAISRPPTR